MAESHILSHRVLLSAAALTALGHQPAAGGQTRSPLPASQAGQLLPRRPPWPAAGSRQKDSSRHRHASARCRHHRGRNRVVSACVQGRADGLRPNRTGRAAAVALRHFHSHRRRAPVRDGSDCRRRYRVPV